ncbi:uncharacterized protein LOC132394738 isoform X5 [Hypanus sabinus]|uniref:uncharacterized protein LOC132394738 isoform X5 n=1 Tax=Hypanus sabinus TaxID=79690 RepID=UPI0028C43A9B|nr:uncharacterized protein LOC132394738 isoform X5 [Hypanus sabinus]
MWLRAWFSLLCLLHVCSQLHPMALSVQYIFAGRYSSVLLEGYSGSELQKGSMIKWSLVLRDRISLMVLHVIGSPNIRYSDYYIHRIDYNTRNGSLTLNNIDLDDRGIYENTITTYGETVQKSYYIKVLDVRDVLIAPVIIQNPKNAVRIAQLTCVTNSWDTDTILWYKGSKLLETDEIYSMSTDNRTLTIKTDQVANCELFTCVIENKVSQSKNSHVLIINGLLLLHRYTFITSIIALVSTSTSFAASIFIIFFALGTYRVHKRHVQLTAVFVLFQLLSFISLLTAALFCVFDPGTSENLEEDLVRCCCLLGRTGPQSSGSRCRWTLAAQRMVLGGDGRRLGGSTDSAVRELSSCAASARLSRAEPGSP